jgi:glycosyltransferase involved in cell wall biosynthesis
MRESMADSGLVSVIVPTKDSARFLEACIASIRSQTYPSIEIIVVDNASVDGTWEIARQRADVALRGGPERSAQCNAAARAARGDFLYRVDADFTLEPRVVAEAVEACEHGADAVCVPNRSDPTVSFWSTVRDFERRMLDGEQVVVGARFFRRRAFDAVGGFDEALVAGEDYDLNNRLVAGGAKIVWIGAEETHLGEPRTLGEIARKSYYYGYTFAPFLRKNRSKGVGQLSPLRMAYARHWREFFRHPGLAAGFVVMQSVKYGCGAAGLAASLFTGAGRGAAA